MTTTTTLVYRVPIAIVIDDEHKVILDLRALNDVAATAVDHALDSGGNVLDPDIDHERITQATRAVERAAVTLQVSDAHTDL